jgi:hypothetical protein
MIGPGVTVKGVARCGKGVGRFCELRRRGVGSNARHRECRRLTSYSAGPLPEIGITADADEFGRHICRFPVISTIFPDRSSKDRLFGIGKRAVAADCAGRSTSTEN